MNNYQYVKFKRGSQKVYNYLLKNNEIDDNTLYFIYDPNDLSITGKLYLGKVLITDDNSLKNNINIHINEKELNEGQVLVYNNGLWENQEVSFFSEEGVISRVVWEEF